MLQHSQQSIMHNISEINPINDHTNNHRVNNWGEWNWNDGLIVHFVPPNWNFPRGITLKALWDLWFFGNADENIRPYRLINKEFDVKVNDKMHYSRAIKTISFTESLISEYRDPVTNAKLLANNQRIHTLSNTDSDKIFDIVYQHMMILLYGTTTGREEELTYGGLYNLITKKNINNQVRKRRRVQHNAL